MAKFFGLYVVAVSSAVPAQNIVELAQTVDELSTLVSAVVAGDLVETLSSPGPFTVFAPTNDAFAALPGSTVDDLLKPENKDALVDILTYHVIGEKAFSYDLIDNTVLKTVEGKNLGVMLGAEETFINTAKVIMPNVEASNGVVHVIDQVLIPDSSPIGNIVEVAVASNALSTLVAAVTAADFAKFLAESGPFTVFAPTDTAFAKLPTGTVDDLLKPENLMQLQEILSYHLVGVKTFSRTLSDGQLVGTVLGKDATVHIGDTVMINDAIVLSPDVMATNGVIHVIDTVLMPPKSDIEV